MAYATTGAILEELPRLPQTTTAAGYTHTASIISTQLVKAEDEINGMLAQRYSVPFTTTPPIVRTLLIDMTSYRVLRSLFGADNRNRTDYLDDYLSAKERLQAIADGKIQLADSTGSIIAERQSGNRIIVNTESYQPIFDLDTITSSKVSSDYLDTVRAAR